MSSIKRAEEEAIALVNMSQAMSDKILSLVDFFGSLGAAIIGNMDGNAKLGAMGSPMFFLMKLLKCVKVTDEDLKNWLTNLLLLTLPALEITVKAILLTNLKNLISCSIDPRIPEQYRKKCGEGASQQHGIDIDISAIDMFDKLSVNPLSDIGKQYYFGLEGVKQSYQFARADDMDAFLWFVKYKGKSPFASEIASMDDFTDPNKFGAKSIAPSDATLLSAFNVIFDAESPSKILAGNTFKYSSNSSVISMCYESKYDENDNIINNTIVPLSCDRTSVNWYVRRADQLLKNNGIGWNSKKMKSNRDFSKERGICNIQYIGNDVSSSLAGLTNDKFRFSILPKPYIHIPDMTHEPPWRFKKILFNDKGEIDSNGKFTITGVKEDKYSDTNKEIEITGGEGENAYKLILNPTSGKLSFADGTTKEIIQKSLAECYPGLTVFEFNYDYVMGMKLFDAKTIAAQIFNTLMDMKIGFNVNASGGLLYDESVTEKIRTIVKEIINSDDSEVNDCYFTFDNSKYSALIRAGEIKRAQARMKDPSAQARYAELIEIINEFDENATFHNQKEVLTRAITKASTIVSDGADESDKDTIEFNFISDMIERTVESIVYSLFTPKVLMLLEVNETLMGGKWQKFTFEDIMKAMTSIITALINEIRDLILQELLKLLEKKLQPLIELITSAIAREQIENYVDAITDLVKNCPFIWFSLEGQQVDTKLDTVDYADIDVSTNNSDDVPNKNC